MDAIKRNKKAEQEAQNYAAWTRNRYETVKAEDGSMFTRVFSHGPDTFADLDTVLKDGYIASLGLGAPDVVSDQPDHDFLDTRLYYGNNPVIRGWHGGFGAVACCGASDAKSKTKNRARGNINFIFDTNENLGFRNSSAGRHLLQ